MTQKFKVKFDGIQEEAYSKMLEDIRLLDRFKDQPIEILILAGFQMLHGFLTQEIAQAKKKKEESKIELVH